jgi:hypothetical protein
MNHPRYWELHLLTFGISVIAQSSQRNNKFSRPGFASRLHAHFLRLRQIALDFVQKLRKLCRKQGKLFNSNRFQHGPVLLQTIGWPINSQ